jgi:hypothetical protein
MHPTTSLKAPLKKAAPAKKKAAAFVKQNTAQPPLADLSEFGAASVRKASVSEYVGVALSLSAPLLPTNKIVTGWYVAVALSLESWVWLEV